MILAPQPFHPLTIPIEGTNLIEASAGTGKTYGIAALFTRLIVLEKLSVERVLVVTFTKAATAELKTRLRARLNDVLQVLEHTADAADDTAFNTQCDDTFIVDLIIEALKQESHARLMVRLKAAISQFDSAAIYTIHGFCQRVLRDYAFWCQVPFNIELSEQQHPYLITSAQDFWRKNVAHHPSLAPLVFKNKLTPDKMLGELLPYLSRPYLNTRLPETDLSQHQQTAETHWQTVCSQLTALETLFWEAHTNLNKNSYRKTTFQNVFVHLQQAASAGRLPEVEKLDLFSVDTLTAKTNKTSTPNTEAYAKLSVLAELAQAIEALRQAETDALVGLQLSLLGYLKHDLQQHKKSHHQRSFDDLLLDVHLALSTDNPHHVDLAKAMADTWPIALIDEFQDTDPLQYGIFRNSFIRHQRPIFLVGDPKQAIYSFRGADIYAYLQASNDALHHYTLDTNYRSHAKLINSISHLFQHKQQPFVLADIGYADVHAAREHSDLSPAQTAVQIRWLNRDDENSNKETLRRRAAEQCADEIAMALNRAAAGELMLKNKPIRAGDIAVLVRTHNEGRLVYQALKQRRLQSVLILRESVFASPEASALAALLAFWLQPQRTDTLRYVLSSILFNQTATDLTDLHHNEAALLGWISAAEAALTDWQRHGVYTALQRFAAEHQIETRLLTQQNERSLSNFHQILELLANEDEQSHIPSSLHQWLLNQIQATKNSGNAESNVLRLESDEALVKIVTMHSAKGLQYPLVYCPFVWDAPDNKRNQWTTLHRSIEETELLAKSQLSEADIEQLSDEELGERLRLLYVALTRAEEQLTIYAAYHANCRDNTFAYLLEGLPQANRTEVQAAYAESKKTGKAAAEMLHLYNNWDRLANHAPIHTDIALDIEAVPTTNGLSITIPPTPYQALSLPNRSFAYIRHTSFTGLSRHLNTAEEAEHNTPQPTIDGAEIISALQAPIAGNELDIYHFPRGANAGVCLHDILENFNFNLPAATQSAATSAVLTRYGFGEEWLEAVNLMLDNTRHTRLKQDISLSDLPPSQLLPEMAFMLHIEDFKLIDLQNWFADTTNGLPTEVAKAARYLNFQNVKGYLNGFIDMICQDQEDNVYVIDYKSNHLGHQASNYNQTAMNEAMAEHHYYLQALIYAIAVARYYQARQRPLDKIHVRYWFVRGFNSSHSDYGNWSWNIDTKQLSQWL